MDDSLPIDTETIPLEDTPKDYLVPEGASTGVIMEKPSATSDESKVPEQHLETKENPDSPTSKEEAKSNDGSWDIEDFPEKAKEKELSAIKDMEIKRSGSSKEQGWDEETAERWIGDHFVDTDKVQETAKQISEENEAKISAHLEQDIKEVMEYLDHSMSTMEGP